LIRNHPELGQGLTLEGWCLCLACPTGKSHWDKQNLSQWDRQIGTSCACSSGTSTGCPNWDWERSKECRSRKEDKEQHPFEVDRKEIISNRSKQANPKAGEKTDKKGGKGQSVRWKAWWRQGNITCAVSEKYASCWVHQDCHVADEQKAALKKAVRVAGGHDECQVRLKGRERNSMRFDQYAGHCIVSNFQLHCDTHLQIPTATETPSAPTLARSNLIRLSSFD